jgi:hypothetical protein
VKKCSKCGEVKGLEEFDRKKRGKLGRRSRCKQCRKEDRIANREAISKRNKEYREKHRERLNAYRRRWGAENREWIRNYDEAHRDEKKERQLLRNYGITLEQYKEMLIAQGGICAFCGKTPEENGQNLTVDHCHETGKVRWLLCYLCNLAIGNFQENVEAMRKAADMLEKFKVENGN